MNCYQEKVICNDAGIRTRTYKYYRTTSLTNHTKHVYEIEHTHMEMYMSFMEIIWDPAGNRTLDLLVTSQLPLPLSHGH